MSLHALKTHRRTFTGAPLAMSVALALSSLPVWAADTTPPSAPGTLTVTKATANSLSLAWIAATDNVAVTAYSIVANNLQVGTTTGALSFTLNGLACNTSYSLYVKAWDGSGNATAGTPIQASTSASCPAPTLKFSRRYEYNLLGKLYKTYETDPTTGVERLVETRTYGADLQLETVTDAKNVVSKTLYDGLGRPSTQIDDATNSNTALQATTVTTFTPLDQVASVQDPKKLITRYTPDALDNLRQLNSPDTGISNLTGVDNAGNVTGWTDARGIATAYSYDALNRLTSRSWGTVKETFSWDNATNGVGQLGGFTDTSGNTVYGYDAQGRLASQTMTVKTGTTTYTRTTGYTWDTAGRLNTITYPSGRKLVYSYDAQGRVSGLTLDGVAILSNIRYVGMDRLAGWTWGNGKTRSFTYDANGRLQSFSLVDTSKTLLWNALGQLDTLYDTNKPGQIQRFYYHRLGFLERMTRGTTQDSYTYDLDGNRQTATTGSATTTYSYPTTSNRLQSTSGAKVQSFSYTASGNEQSNGSFTEEYSSANRLIRVKNASTSVVVGEYAYNALGQRVMKRTSGGYLIQNYDLAGHLQGLYAPAVPNAAQEFIWLGDIPVGWVKLNPANTSQTQVFYIHADHLNTPRQIADSAGKLIWRWDSDAFGSIPPDQDPDKDGVVQAFNLRFPGQYFDSETGRNYNYFRDYDPNLGRYIQSDPIGLNGGVNTYGYVGANPLGAVDPRGLEKHDPNSAYCKNLLNKINNIRNDLDKRWQELAEDQNTLPEYIGPNEGLWQTRRGHRTIINQYDLNLRRLEDKFDDECGPPPPPVPVKKCAGQADGMPATPTPTTNAPSNIGPSLIKGGILLGVFGCAVFEPCGAYAASIFAAGALATEAAQ